MPSPLLPATIAGSTPPRSSGSQSNVSFPARALRGTFTWGAAPGVMTLTYLDSDNTGGLTTGSLVTITVGSHYFAGLCMSDVINEQTEQGGIRTLEFSDLREFLKWDWTFCAFNKPDVRLINGVRIKRYKHMYPTSYNSYTWTYTFTPLLAWQILEAILVGPTIGSPWVVDLTGSGEFPGGVLNMPLFDFDCLESKRLDQVLSEIAQRSGTVFTLTSTPQNAYTLTFTRKGGNPNAVVVFPPQTDDNRVGDAISGNATNVAILGDRNRYQVMDIAMIADWAPAWQQFLVFEVFADNIYNIGSDPNTGIPFTQTANDPEQFIGRQLATAFALTITLRQYVALTGNAAFQDLRKYAGRSRMDMPCALYIETLVFRAFRPNFTFLKNAYGNNVPIDSMDIVDQLLCRVSHDPIEGTMTFFPLEPVEGNGYAIVKGYQVGSDLFKAIKPEQFNINFFADPQRSWQAANFQIDDSGEGVRFIIFDFPVIVSSNLLVDVDGNKVINAQFALTVPPVIAALVFEAEKFVYWKGTYPNVSRDHVENVNGLGFELVLQDAAAVEVLYADGQTADQKADAIANFLLIRQFFYFEGGYKGIWDGVSNPSTFGARLSSLIDRVSPVLTPEGGFSESVDFTNERKLDAFEPEREFERKSIQNTLFPGQQALRMQAEVARKIAAGFRQLAFVPRLLSSLLNGTLTSTQPLQVVWLDTPTAGVQLPMGTVIRKTPTVTATGQPAQNTIATQPADVSSSDTVFVGVTVRHNEDQTKPFHVQAVGEALARVQGPVGENDPVGLNTAIGPDNTFLVKGGTPVVGRSRQSIADTSVKTIKVDLGAGGGGTVSGMNYQGIYVPGQAYNTEDVVLIQPGPGQGTYISTADGNTNDPRTGINWTQISWDPEWF